MSSAVMGSSYVSRCALRVEGRTWEHRGCIAQETSAALPGRMRHTCDTACVATTT